jgi:hypothetical protein
MRKSNNSTERRNRKRRIVASKAAMSDGYRNARPLLVDTTFLQPTVATAVFASDAAGLIPRGAEVTLFQDGRNVAGAASGLPINAPADASFFNGEVPAGQIVLLESLGFTNYQDGVAPLSSDQQLLNQNVEVVMDLRGTIVDLMGSVVDWMDILGGDGAGGNGRGRLGRSEWQIPMELEPQDPFSITLRVCRDVTVAVDTPFFYRAHLRSPRIYDERVLALS